MADRCCGTVKRKRCSRLARGTFTMSLDGSEGSRLIFSKRVCVRCFHLFEELAKSAGAKRKDA